MGNVDRIPPHDLELESGVIGVALLRPQHAHEVLDFLDAEDFYGGTAALVFATLKEHHAAGEVIDPMQVEREHRWWATTAMDRALYTAELPQHVARIKALSQCRTVAMAAELMVSRAYNAEAPERILTDALERLMAGVERHGKQAVSVQSLLEDRLANCDRPRDFLTVPGFAGLHLGRGDLVILGARPGAGKTAMALWWALEWSASVPVRFYSYEMSGEQLTDRIIARHGGVTVEEIEEGLDAHTADWVRGFVAEGVGPRNMSVEVASGMAPAALFSSLRRFAAKGGRVAVIDYLQLATDSRLAAKQGMVQSVTAFTNGLKDVALDTGLTIVALSQLNRVSAERGGIKVPILSDLRESGAIEQAGNEVALMLALPCLRQDAAALSWALSKMDGLDFSSEHVEVKEDPSGDSDMTLVLVSWAKVRQGRLRRSWFIFDGRTMSYRKVERKL